MKLFKSLTGCLCKHAVFFNSMSQR